MSLYENYNIDQEKKKKLLQLQLDLDKIYEYKAKGTFIRQKEMVRGRRKTYKILY